MQKEIFRLAPTLLLGNAAYSLKPKKADLKRLVTTAGSPNIIG